MSRGIISLVSNNELIFFRIQKETASCFTVVEIKDYQTELTRFSSEESDCLFLDADMIPQLYLKIFCRLAASHSIPTVIVFRKKRLSLNEKKLFPNSLFIDMLHDNGIVLEKLTAFLEKCSYNISSHSEQNDIAMQIEEGNQVQYAFERTYGFSPFLHVNSTERKYGNDKYDIFSGVSPKMREFKRLVTEAAESEKIVLLTGESGTGKSFTAQYIHRHSVRASRKMQFINVSDIVPSLAESELFGVEKGAYTSAVVKPGIFEAAEGSTLFLDEIGDLSYELQSKLLDVIETRTFMKVGSVNRKSFDARLIFATNADLNRKIQRNQFRKDLFYRIAVLTIEVPPLREHIEDLPLLAKNFVSKRIISMPALEKLCSYSWPGNIRELKNVLYRADAFCSGEEIRADDIMFC